MLITITIQSLLGLCVVWSSYYFAVNNPACLPQGNNSLACSLLNLGNTDVDRAFTNLSTPDDAGLNFRNNGFLDIVSI